MRKEILRLTICLLAFPVLTASAQDTAATAVAVNKDVKVYDNVLKTAEWAGFKYEDALARAKNGDVMATWEMLEFHAIVDGVEGLNHAVTCLELIPIVGDVSFARAVSACKPKLKQLLGERLVLAQGRTKKEELRKSLTDWAPYTWAFLTDQSIAIPAPEKSNESATLTGHSNAPAAPTPASDARGGAAPISELSANPNNPSPAKPQTDAAPVRKQ